MKKSELRKLVSEYKELKSKRDLSKTQKIAEKLAELRHRYYHETGRELESDLANDFNPSNGQI